MPNCQTCGAAIAKGLHACPRCGASISADPSPLTPVPRLRLLPQPTSDRAQPQLRPSRRPHQAAPTKTIVPRLGVIGLILSLLGLITPFLALLGLILSILGYRQAKRCGMAKGFAIAGTLVGIIALLIYALPAFS